MRFSQRTGSRPLPTHLVKGALCHGPRYFPSGDVGAPHLLANEKGELFRLCERAVYQRTSIPWALPPWSDETSPFTRRSATPRLATNERFLLRASPCPRAFCGLPHGQPEKTTLLWTTTFRPNSATRFDARARPIRATAPLHLGLAAPRLATCDLAIAIAGEPCPSAQSPRRDPHGLVLPARCFTGVRRSHHRSELAACAPGDHGAVLYLPPTRRPRLASKPSHSRNFADGDTGRRSRAKDWHVPRPVLGVFGASAPPRGPPNILLSPIGYARSRSGVARVNPNQPRLSASTTSREGWRLVENQDVWSRF